MVLMQSIVDEKTGTTIVGKGQKLTKEMLNRLKHFDNIPVWISIASLSELIKGHSVWKVDKKTLEIYKDYAKALRNVFLPLKEGNKLSLDQLVNIAEDMIQKFSDNYKILACVNLLKEMEQGEYNHSVNVAFISLVLGRWLMFDEQKLKNLLLAALLHDVGKNELAPYLYHKDESEMNNIERIEYRRHPILAYEKLAAFNELDNDVLKGVLTHHERCDGLGFPLSLREKRINDIAKVIGIVDTYDTLMKKQHVFSTVKTLGVNMMRKFNVNFLLQFCSNMMNYYVGALVVLNTGQMGEVVFIQSQAIHRPIIKIENEYINLYEKTHLEIEEVIL